MPINNITAKEWSDLLQEVFEPVEKGQSPVKKYVVLHENPQSIGNYSFEVVTSEKLKEGTYQKLSLSQITAVTEKILKNDVTKTSEDKSGIATGIERIIQAKDVRFQEARISRGILRAISYLLFATILGSAWGWLIKTELDAQEDEISTAYQFMDRLREAAYFNAVNQRIRIENKPLSLEKIGQNIKKDIETEMKDLAPGMLKRFQGDYKRSDYHMMIKEGKSTLLDHQRVLHQGMTDETAITLAQKEFEKLQSLFKKEDNAKWLVLLQLVFTQQTSYPLLGYLKGHCLALNFEMENDYEPYVLDSIAPEEIRVRIVRNDKGIEKLQIKATSTTAFFHKNRTSELQVNKDSELVPGKKIQSELHFEITLNHDKEPEITVTKYHHEMIRSLA